MGLYAIGDLHLHFQQPEDARRFEQVMGALWENHAERFKNYCAETLREDDTLILAGDHSWGRRIWDCMPDFDFMEQLPGRKILIRGNHDLFWNAGKTASLNERFRGRLCFLQGNYYAYEDYALIGSKGYCNEGKDTPEHAALLTEREEKRLRDVFAAAKADGFRKFLMFLHYPPTALNERESAFTRLAEEYRVEQVVYAHCHGKQHFHDSIRGEQNGVRYTLVSGDCLGWKPEKLLD